MCLARRTGRPADRARSVGRDLRAGRRRPAPLPRPAGARGRGWLYWIARRQLDACTTAAGRPSSGATSRARRDDAGPRARAAGRHRAARGLHRAAATRGSGARELSHGRVVARVRLRISASCPDRVARLTAGGWRWPLRTARTRASWWSSTPTPVPSCCADRASTGSRRRPSARTARRCSSAPGDGSCASAAAAARRAASRVRVRRPSTPRARSRSRSGRRILIGGTAVRVAAERLGAPLWGADGEACLRRLRRARGMRVSLRRAGPARRRAPANARRARGRELRLALGRPTVGASRWTSAPAPRRTGDGKRRPWPKRAARDYAMSSARGDAAMRRIALRASRALRRGDTRTDVLRRVRLDFDAAAGALRRGAATPRVVEELRQRARSLADRRRLAAARRRRRGQLLRSAAVS